MDKSHNGLILRYYPSIRLEGLRKTTKTISEEQPVSGLRFEPWTSQKWRVNHLMPFGIYEKHHLIILNYTYLFL
jgi:hypothetical protein